MSQADSALVARLKSGHEDAWSSLVLEFAPILMRIYRSIAPDKNTAEDFVQETFETVFSKLTELREPSKFSSWLKRIACNKARAQMRRCRPLCTIPDGAEAVVSDPSLDADPARVAERQDNSRKLYEVLQKLQPDDYSIVILHYFDGMTHEKIGRLIGIPKGTVSTRMNRVIKMLRTIFSCSPTD